MRNQPFAVSDAAVNGGSTNTPTSPYFAKDGKQLPGTTTILGRWKDSQGLLFWAHKVGYEQGLERKQAKLYEARDTAATIGTFTHALIEAHIKGESEPIDPPDLAKEDIDRGRNAYQQFVKWEKQTGIFVVSWEKPLISEQYRYGGTPDSLGEIDGSVCMLDWKASNALYPDHLLQLAAYIILWDENHPDNPVTGGAHILRFSKNWGDFEHRSFDNLDLEKKQFILLREAYANDQQIKKRI